MFVLDTNVVSELRKAKKGRADKNVIAWANSVRPSDLYLSAITILELELGTLLLERRDLEQGRHLRKWLEFSVMSAFSDRILPVDIVVAQRCAQLHLLAPRSDRDALIAATALVHGMTIATRNVPDFESTGVAICNPWNL